MVQELRMCVLNVKGGLAVFISWLVVGRLGPWRSWFGRFTEPNLDDEEREPNTWVTIPYSFTGYDVTVGLHYALRMGPTQL